MKRWLKQSQIPELVLMIMAFWLVTMATLCSYLWANWLASPRAFRLSLFIIAWLLVNARDYFRDRRLKRMSDS